MLRVVRKINSNLQPLASAPFRLAARSFTALRYSFLGVGADDFLLPETAQENAEFPIIPSQKQVSFTFALISLSAQVARADGAVSRAEYLAFRDAFPLTGGICGKIRQLFTIACHSKTPFTSHVLQIKNLFPQQKELFFSLVERLFRIATADAPLSHEEGKILAKISHLLGLSPSEYSALYDKYSRPLPPHAILGVKRRSPKTIIKQQYHALMNRYHPDKFSGLEVSKEVQLLLTLKTTEISEAYRSLTKKAA